MVIRVFVIFVYYFFVLKAIEGQRKNTKKAQIHREREKVKEIKIRAI